MSQSVESEISEIDQFLKQLQGGGGGQVAPTTGKTDSSSSPAVHPGNPLLGAQATGLPRPSPGVGLQGKLVPLKGGDDDDVIGDQSNLSYQPASVPRSQLVSYDESSSDSTSTSSGDSGSTEDLLSDGSDEENNVGPVSSRGEKKLVEASDNVKGSGYGPKVRGELGPCDLPEIEDLRLELPEGTEMTECGHITSQVDDLIIVQGSSGSEPLDAETVLWSVEKRSIGKVFEVFGPVKLPFYSIRKQKEVSLESMGVAVGSKVHFIPGNQAMTNYVFAGEKPLRRDKGSDASWQNDIEPPEECLDYSDDEAERVAKRKLQAKRKAGSDGNKQEVISGSQQQQQQQEKGSGTDQSVERNKKPAHSHKKQHHKGKRRQEHGFPLTAAPGGPHPPNYPPSGPHPPNYPPSGPHPPNYHPSGPHLPNYPPNIRGQPPPSIYSNDPRMQMYFQGPPVDLQAGPFSPERVESPVFNPNYGHSSMRGLSSPPAHSNNPRLHQHYFPMGSGPYYHPPPIVPGAGLTIRGPHQGIPPPTHAAPLPPPLLPGLLTSAGQPAMLPRQQAPQPWQPVLQPIRPSQPLRPPLRQAQPSTNQIQVTNPVVKNAPTFQETDL